MGFEEIGSVCIILPDEKEREICKIEMDFKKFGGVLI